MAPRVISPSNKKIDGFTPDQRFFLAWAQVWRSNTLPDTKAQLIVTDSHSPNEYRTIGAAVNMDAWYKAFNVKPGDKLYKKPEDRMKLCFKNQLYSFVALRSSSLSSNNLSLLNKLRYDGHILRYVFTYRCLHTRMDIFPRKRTTASV